MKSIGSYAQLETLGRERLSAHFFMRDFLYSEIAAWHGIRNLPDFPDRAIAAGKMLCTELLEPLQGKFGNIHIRSGYRSPTVNQFGNEHGLNCASNASNYAGHIWDYPDANGHTGATACIVVPWFVDQIARGGSWLEMAWWIHDNLPYNSMHFFPKLAAFNLNWNEVAARRIDSYAEPKGCLTRPGMPKHSGKHGDLYLNFSALQNDPLPVALPSPSACPVQLERIDLFQAEQRCILSPPPDLVTDIVGITGSDTAINYRAVHTRNPWRKARNHKSLDSAINGVNGASGLFAGKVRIDYAAHGEPLYVLIWRKGAQVGYAVKRDPTAPNGIRVVTVPIADLLSFEERGLVSPSEIAKYFSKAQPA